MRILYFTDGSGIDMSGMRESLLRIPEVLSSIRQGQEQSKYVDLMAAMTLSDGDFSQVPFVLRTLLINLVQRGLHQRWANRNYRADLILRKINYRSFDEIKSDMMCFLQRKNENKNEVPVGNLQLLHFLSHVEITIIGPGYDEVEIWLRKVASLHSNVEIQIKDVIAADPHLTWFWPQVKTLVLNEEVPLI